MELAFEVGGRHATFRRDPWMGSADLEVADEVVRLQSPLRLSTHFNRWTTRCWRQSFGGRQVEVVMQRPRVFGGFRKKTFTVRVDGTVVVHTTAV
jgi:hypothetical protein